MSRNLCVSRATIYEMQVLFLQSSKSWDDDRFYELFYTDKFEYKPKHAPVDYSCIHKELKKTGITEKLLWEVYCTRYEKYGVNVYFYTTFARKYKKYTADKYYTSHIKHKPRLAVEAD